MKFSTIFYIVVLAVLAIIFLPLIFSVYSQIAPAEGWNEIVKQREKDCDICLSSFKIPCNATAGLNRECLDKYLEANSVCVKNCTMPFKD